MYVNVCMYEGQITVILQERCVDRVQGAYPVNQVGQGTTSTRIIVTVSIAVGTNDMATERIASPAKFVENAAERPEIGLE